MPDTICPLKKKGGGGELSAFYSGMESWGEIAASDIVLEAGPRMYSNGLQVICRMGGY